MRAGRGPVLIALAALVGGATARGGAQAMTGFSRSSAAEELRTESALLAIPDTARARQDTRVLAARAHVAGSPAQVTTANYVLQQMGSWGLDTLRVSFRVYLPYHDSTIVERITPTRRRLDLREPPVPGDPTTLLPGWPAMNGNSGAGDVTAGVLYVNYGLPEDYAVLDSLGITVKGRIVMARYGRSFRGIKAREAEARGAVGVLLYSDPEDDGYRQGAVYPEGPMRNANGVQRGSILNTNGDPTTPGWPSIPGAKRLPIDSLPVAHIPVVPISYGNAALFLGELKGPSVPNQWQGGLGFRYHIGDGAVRGRVAVWPQRGANAYKTIINTFGILRGSEFPDELVILGGHRDGWGPGAADNVSGVSSVMEAARAWASVARSGARPRRTLVFATFDAEEWGLVGSTEWTELMADTLRANAVAYINQDMSAWGRRFGGGGTASLRGVLWDVTRRVPFPGDTASVFSHWLAQSRTPVGQAPRLGDLGGGSDFAGFYNGLGIPSLDFSFGGTWGEYHSAYDTYTWMERFGDPGYLSHRAAAQIGALLMARLANADVVPFDYAELGDYLSQLVVRTVPDSATQRALAPELADLAGAAGELAGQGRAFNAARDRRLDGDVPMGDALRSVNASLREVERALTRPEGLVGRPLMRNLVFASDRDNGYADIALPGLAEALRDHDLARARTEARDLARRIHLAAALVGRAAGLLR